MDFAHDPYDESNERLQAVALARCARLLEQDEALRRSLPDHEAIEKIRRSRSTIETVATACALYAQRPCLGDRAFQIHGGELRYLPEFRAISYAELWSRVEALASGLAHEKLARTGDMVGICGFGSVDWIVSAIACLYLGTVSAPLQTSMSPADMRHVIAEAELVCVACSMEQLGLLSGVLPQCPTVRSLIIMDLHGGEAQERRALEPWRDVLAKARPGLSLRTMREVELAGRAQGIVPMVLPTQRAEPDPLVTLMYTSGSTGTPKGAMFPESVWLRRFNARRRLPDFPLVNINFNPLNHLAGRGQAINTLIRGGVTYFALESNMSSLFEDIRLARPTELFLVPRVSELIHQQFQAEVVRRAAHLAAGDGDGRRPIEAQVMAEMRGTFLGDRLLAVTIGAAPTPREVISFLKRCFEIPVYDGYGSTEAGVIIVDGRIDEEAVLDYKLVDRPELGYQKTDKPFPRGELYARTNALVSGYYKNESATKDLFDAEGYMITGDIVEERGPGHLVWVDRAKNVLKLAQGEFVAISRLEGVFTAGSPFIHQIFLYGNGLRSYLLAVVVPEMQTVEAHLRKRGEEPSEASVKQLLRDEINRVAREEGLRGYEVPRDFLVEQAPFTRGNGLLTESAKPARPRLRERYGARLEALYEAIEQKQIEELTRLEEDREGARSVAEKVKKAMEVTLGLGDIDVERTQQSFIQLGGDSLSAVRLGSLVQELSGVSVPVGLLLDPTRSVRAVVDYVENALSSTPARHRVTYEDVHGAGTKTVRATDVRLDRFLGADEIAAFTRARREPPAEIRNAFLTGANGFLGRFLVLSLLERLPATGKLHCIVRAPSDSVAAARLRDVYRTDPALEAELSRLAANGRLVVLAGDLMKPRFGLADDVYERLCDEVDCVVHNGALVNHAFTYPQLFEPNVLGTVEAIRLALARRDKRLCFVSTIAAVAGLERNEPIREDEDIRALWPERPIEGGYATGYATSKWACEILLRDAHDRFGVPVSVFRPSAILAHSRYRGQINVPDWFTRLLCGLIYTGIAPGSFYAGGRHAGHLDGLPVDVVARSIAAISAGPPFTFANYHVVNPYVDDGISLDVVVSWLQSAGYPIRRVDDYPAWYQAFRKHLVELDERRKQHSPLPIVHQWESPAHDDPGHVLDARRLLERLQSISGDLAALPHVSEGFIHKYLDDMAALHLIDPPAVQETGT